MSVWTDSDGTFTYEVGDGDSLSFDGEVYMGGVLVWLARIDTATDPSLDFAGQMTLLRRTFAEQLADVLNRPRPYCECPTPVGGFA